MEVVLIIVAAAGLFLLWMNTAATVALYRDDTLDGFQRSVQSAFVWFIPFLGALTVLHLTVSHFPQAIPRWVLRWPLRYFLETGSPKRNENRDDNEGNGIDLALSNRRALSGDVADYD